MEGLTEENRVWLLNSVNHSYIVRYLRHQKSPISNLIKKEKSRVQFRKLKSIENTMRFKLLIATSVIDDKSKLESLKEIETWLDKIMERVHVEFFDIANGEFDEMERREMENQVAANDFVIAIRKIEGKYLDRKRACPSIEKLDDPASKRVMRSIHEGFNPSNSEGSIDSEMFDKCLEFSSDEDSENDDSMEDKHDDTIKEDLSNIDERINQLKKMVIQTPDIEFKNERESSQRVSEELKHFLEINKANSDEKISKIEERVMKMELKLVKLDENLNSQNENLKLIQKSQEKMLDIVMKAVEKINTNTDRRRSFGEPSLNSMGYKETIMKQRLELLPTFSGKESFEQWKDKYEATLKEFAEVNLPYFILYEWLLKKTCGEPNRIVQQFSIYKEHSHSMAWNALADKYHAMSDNLVVIEKINSIGKASNGEVEKLEIAYYILVGALVKSTEEQQMNYVDNIYSSVLDELLKHQFLNWKKSHMNKSYIVQMKEFLQEKMNKTSAIPTQRLDQSKKLLCWMCHEDHEITACTSFKSKPLENRLALVKLIRVCWNCLEPGHNAKICKNDPCPCGKYRHKLLHVCESNLNTTFKNYSMFTNSIVSKSATVIDIQGKKVITLADTGAALSLITSNLVKKLNLKPVGREHLKIEGVGNKEYCANIYLIDILKDSYVFFEFPKLAKIEQKALKNEIPGINGNIELLIGHDNFELICPMNYKSINKGILIETPIGKFMYNKKRGLPVNLIVKRPTEDKPISINTENANLKLEKEIVISEGKMYAPLMLRDVGEVELCSMNIAKQRLITQLRRFYKDKAYEESYDEAVYAYINENYAIELPENVTPKNFIPHHLVIVEGKKPRLVYACNTIGKDKISLNDILYKGKIQLNKIVDILINWRRYKFWLSGDIKAMFHQIRLMTKDLGYCCFLYWKKGVKKNINNMTIFVMTRHVFGATDSPHIAVTCLNKILDNLPSDIDKEEIKKNFYMDDLVLSSDSKESLMIKMGEVKKTLDPYFALGKFYGNFVEAESQFKDKWNPSGKILGINYDIKNDELIFDTHKWLITRQSPTFKTLASVSKKVFDPMGLLEPMTACLKEVYSKAMQLKLNWKDKLPTNIINEWNGWVRGFERDIHIKRCTGDPEEYYLFGDASISRYGGCIYGKIGNTLHLLCAKSVVKQVNTNIVNSDEEISIVRNELNAAVLISEMAKKFVAVTNKPAKFFSDSQAVLKYIANCDIPLKQFERSRIRKILNITSKDQWFYINSNKNPADVLTKWCSFDFSSWLCREMDISNIYILFPWEHSTMSKEKILDKLREQQEKYLNEQKCKNLNILEQNGLKYVVLRSFNPSVKNKRILLTNKMPIAKELAEMEHHKAHKGPDSIRTLMREKFWTIGETELASRVYKECKECGKFRKNNKFAMEGNEPIQEQQILSVMRHVGLDHTGAIRNNENEKYYILIICCISTKKVKLEYVSSLDKDITELALIRTESEFGPLETIKSDNHKTYESLSKKHGNWKFTAPYAPHQGGLWERTVQAVKRILNPYLKNNYSNEEWRTLLMVAESAINNKPLIKLLNDPDQVIVTPTKIARAYSFATEGWSQTKKWKKKWLQIAMGWHKLLLNEILMQKRWNKNGIIPKKGMQVLIKEKDHRTAWKKGKIEELIKSHDNKIRNVVVQMDKGGKLTRNLTNIVPF